MSHHQILRLDGDQAERCDGNLPFASRLMAVLSMTGVCAENLNPNVAVMKSAQERVRTYEAGSPNRA